MMSCFVSPIRKINGIKLLDGGLSYAIPIRKSISDGNTKNRDTMMPSPVMGH
jgi:predicted patatin/cPLA2 family phospholipase